MKKISLIILVLLFAKIGFSQSKTGTSMVPILQVAVPVLQKIEESNMEIVRMEFDIVSTYKETYRYLYKGWTYRVLAFGDDRVSDIDVEIYKLVGEEWVIITKDKDASSAALAQLSPIYDGEYKIVVRAYKYNYPYTSCHYGLIIYHE